MTYEDLAIKFHQHVGEQNVLGAIPQSARREENHGEDYEAEPSAPMPDLQPEVVPGSCPMEYINAATAMPDLISEQIASSLPTNSGHPQPWVT